MAKMLRDKNGKLFLPAEQLKGLKGYTEFDTADEADMPTVGDGAGAETAPKPAETEPKPAETEPKPAAKPAAK